MLSLPFAKEWQQRHSLETAVASNRKAVAISTQLYTEGQTDFLNVLTAQRALVLAEGALVRSQSSIALDVIALYKALGGGWDRGGPALAPPLDAALGPLYRVSEASRVSKSCAISGSISRPGRRRSPPAGCRGSARCGDR